MEDRNTIVVPAGRETFEERFLGEGCWYAIRISDGMIDRIRYVAAYQTAPVSAVTHYAEVAAIEAVATDGYKPPKYKLEFAHPAREIGPIELPQNPDGFVVPRGPRYTSFERLAGAETLEALF